MSGLFFVSLTYGNIKSSKGEERVRIKSVVIPTVVFLTHKTGLAYLVTFLG